MFTIRGQQFEEFDRSSEEQFISELTATTREQNIGIPPRTSDALLRRMVSNGVQRAKAHGVQRRSAIGRFVGLMFAVAPNFDHYPPARAVLADTSLPPDDRVAALFERITPAQWAGASKRYDLAEWGEPWTSRMANV